VKSEVPIEIHHRVPGNRDAGTLPVVLGLPMGHDHAQTVHRSALEEADQGATAGWLDRWTAGGVKRVHCPIQEQRIQTEAHQTEGAGPNEDASGD
jgi:hypothetical protein